MNKKPGAYKKYVCEKKIAYIMMAFRMELTRLLIL